MAWIWTMAISVIIFLYLLDQLLNLKKKRNLPPGPNGLPILGHFHLLSKNPHQDLHHLAQKYGPIMLMRFGTVATVVVSSPAAAVLFLKTYDLVFANRPYHEASYHLSYEQRNIVAGKYGAYWRDMRKLCVLELLSNLKIQQFQPMRATELRRFVGELRQAAADRRPVDTSAKISSLGADLTCMMVFGRKFADRDLDAEIGFMEVMRETVEESSAFNIGDYFPYLRWLDLHGSTRRLKKLSKIFDGFLERIIDDHAQIKKQSTKETARDFVDTLMDIMESGEAGFHFDRRHVKAVLLTY